MANMNENEFVDPLDAIVEKHRVAAGMPASEPVTEPTTPDPDDFEAPVGDYDDDEYGDNDLDLEIEREEHESELRREEAIKRAQENKKPDVQMAPQSLDKEFQKESIDFQMNTLGIVTTMVNKVVAKHHLTSGGIPEKIRRQVMGDLVELYYNNGEVITEDFEQKILDNWEGYVPDNGSSANETSNTPIVQNAQPATINIDVKPDTPVTVNVDDSITSVLGTTNVVNIRVREVTEEEMRHTVVIENSQQDGIIETFDSGINDTPITLPMSGYRTTIRPVNWFESLQMAAPTSHNQTDFQMRKWSVIYKHMKNNSIGPFKTFDEFMKNTKYADGELLAWAVLVATADEVEELTVSCGNPKCKKQFIHKYQPRTIVHLEEDRIPKTYMEVANVPAGPAAVALFNSIAGKRKLYELPHTKIIVEFNEPSAYEQIQTKIPAIKELYTRYRPDDPNMDRFGRNMANDPTMMEFNYKVSCMTQISAMTIVKNDKHYRYTNWDDIDRIINEALDVYDSSILLNLVGKIQTASTPAEFYISNVVCPHCGHTEERLDIDDIAQNLLFQISRRLEAMEINFNEMDQN